MKTIESSEVKKRLSRILDEASTGESFMITQRGRPIAVLEPYPGEGRRSCAQAIADLRKIREDLSLRGLSIREIVEKGRT